MMKNNLKKGIFYAFLASIISGIAIFYAKISVIKIDPLVLTTLRNTTAAIILFVYYLLFVKKSAIKNLGKKEWIKLILIGLIGGGLPFYLFFSGLKLIGAQTSNLIHKTLFLWVGILAVIFLKEKIKPIYVISYILVFVATFLFTPLKLDFSKGEILVLTATLFWAVENIIAKKVLTHVFSQIVGVFRMGIGSLILFVTILISGKLNLLLSIDKRELTMIVIGGTILSLYVYFWYKALKYAPASLVTLILTFSLVVGTIFNGVFAGVKILIKDIYTCLLISIAMFVLIVSNLKLISNLKFQNSKPQLKS